ncbi:unnamed protein product [Ophioblennius macclurei]
MREYEEITAFLGQWGRFQQEAFFLICLSILTNGLGVFSIVFLADIPTHHCLIPGVNLTDDWYRAAIPVEVLDGKQGLSRCSRYRLDVVRNLSAQGLVPGRDVNLTDLEQEGCVDGWSYSRDIYQSTLVSEFDLVCSEQWKQPFTSTVFFLGVLSGCFVSGPLSDRFGRKPVFFATMGIQAIFTLVSIFTPNWTVYSVIYFLNGLGQISNYIAAFVLGTEILTGKVRVIFSSMGICLSYAVGYMCLPLLAYFVRDWKSLTMILSLPGLLYMPLWWFVPESPRWLLSQGRADEAEAILRKAAVKNKVEAPQAIFVDEYFQDDEAKSKEGYNPFSIVRTADIRNTTLILCLLWFSLSIGYFGLSLNTSRLHTDPYISCFISAAVEVPAYVSSGLALRYLPRRLAVILILILGGVSLFCIQLVPQDLPGLSTALEMVGKFGITTGTSLMFVYTAELYPTALRNTATATCTAVSRIGSCVAPFLLQLSVYSRYLPQMTLGSLAIVSVFATIFLPESFGHPLPQTMEQMQKRKRMKCPFVKRPSHLPKSVVISESQL